MSISRDDYSREVTEASMVDDRDEDEDKDVEIIGTGVASFLYRRGTLPNYFYASLLGQDAVYLSLRGQE